MAIKNNFPTIRPSLNLDFANSKQVDPRITFTRASTATYWDGKTFAKAEENLLRYSQDFDNAAWIIRQGSVLANQVAAPDGSVTADKFIPDTVSAEHFIYQSMSSVSGQQTHSVFMKAGGYGFGVIRVDDVAVYRAYFDLTNGVLGTVDVGLSAAIAYIGDGWYRCGITFTDANAGSTYLQVGCAPSNGSATFSGDGTSGVHLWGAQLEQRSQATAYTPTTDRPITNYQPALQAAAANVARFDHNPVTGESLGLLIEEQRTNSLLWSSGFDNAYWDKLNATILPSTTIAPDGTLTASKLIPTSTSTGSHLLYKTITIASQTASIYAKAGGYSSLTLQLTGGGFGSKAVFNLSTGVVTSAPGPGVATIIHVGNGWYRCSLNDATATGSPILRVYVGDGSTPYAGDGYSGIYIWGAQIEAGAFATSYIPTTTAQVTRAADAASMTGANFSSWYRQDAGTLYAETRRIGTAQTLDEGAGVEITSGEFQKNLIQLMYDSGSYNRVAVRVFHTSGLYIFPGPSNSPNFTVGEAARKFAAAIMSGGTALASNGSVGASYSEAFAPPLVTMLSIKTTSYGAQGSDFNGYIKKIAYYPKRLSNAELQALTA